VTCVYAFEHFDFLSCASLNLICYRISTCGGLMLSSGETVDGTCPKFLIFFKLVIHGARTFSFHPFCLLSLETVLTVSHKLLIVSFFFVFVFIFERLSFVSASNRHLLRSLELAFTIFHVSYPSKSHHSRDEV
jgi:hypothetical protein